MTYTLEKLPDEPIIVATIHAAYVVERDIAQSDADGIKLLDTCEEPVFYIVDIRALKEISMDDVFLAVRHSSYSDDSLYRHPMIREIIFVTTNPTIKTAADGLGHAAFGSVQACTVDTLDDALAYAREQSDK